MIPFAEKKKKLSKEKKIPTLNFLLLLFFIIVKGRNFSFLNDRTSPPHLHSLALTCLHDITVKFWFWSLPPVGESSRQKVPSSRLIYWDMYRSVVFQVKSDLGHTSVMYCMLKCTCSGWCSSAVIIIFVCFWFTLIDSIPWNDAGQQNYSSQTDVLFVLNVLITFSLTISHQYIGLAVSEHYFVS